MEGNGCFTVVWSHFRSKFFFSNKESKKKEKHNMKKVKNLMFLYNIYSGYKSKDKMKQKHMRNITYEYLDNKISCCKCPNL